MPYIRICPCGHTNPVEAFQCEKDGIDLAAIPPTWIPDQESPDHFGILDQTQSAQRLIKENGTCSNPSCGYNGNPAEAETCLRCDTPLVTSLSPISPPATIPYGTTRDIAYKLRFSFGEIEINGSFGIGRDPEFSPIAARITDMNMVSRRHAEVKMSGEKLTVIDKNSTNKVKVNGQVIASETPVLLREGDELSFSSQLQAKVVCGGI